MNKVFLIFQIFIFFSCTDISTKFERDNPKDPKANYDDNPPQVTLSIIPASGLLNETLFLFDASDAIEPELPNTELYFKWDFNGDGNWDTEGYRLNKISRVLNKSGYINSRVYVEGGHRLFTIKTQSIYIFEKPYADFAWKKDTLSNYHLDAFLSHDFERTDQLQYRWDIQSDGLWDTNFSSSSNYVFFSSSNLNTIKLQVKDVRNYTSTIEKQISTFNIQDATVNFSFNGNCNDEGPLKIIGFVNGATLTKDRTGNDNGAYYFDGLNDYIDIGNHSELKPMNNFTISFWINISELQRPVLTSNYENSSITHGYYFESNINGRMYFGATLNNSTYSNYNVIIPNEWFHIVCIHPSVGIPTLYINGKLNFRGGSRNSDNINYNSGSFNIGRVASEYFKGTIDNLIIFNRTLSVEEINNLYHRLD
jgi:hypothetical protein